MGSTPTEQSLVSSPPTLEELTRTLLLPYIIGYTAGAAPSQEPREIVVIVNPRTGSLTMIGGYADVESIIRDKEGPLPASKASIDALQMVKVVEEGLECAICLSEFEVGGEAKQMPCKHRYHADCIDKWLGKRGSCPICRYTMPVEEEDKIGKEDEIDGDGVSDEREEEGIGERGRDPELAVHVYYTRRHIRRRRRDGDLDSDTDSDSDSGRRSEIGDDNSVASGEASESLTQDMEIDTESSSQEMDTD